MRQLVVLFKAELRGKKSVLRHFRLVVLSIRRSIDSW